MPDTSRSSDSRLFSLLSEWDARRAAGEAVAPADLCPADLTLQRQLAEHIAAVLAVEKQRGRLEPEATDGWADEETAPVHGFPSPPGLQLHEEIGRGGMGVVFRAVDREFGRPLAVKVMRPGLPEGRFLAEADTMARLQHPGVPPVFARGRLPGGQPYFAMKLVAGRSLHEALAARPSPQQDVPQLLAVFEQVCQAVGYAHSQGVIHRDLKPHNVMIGAFGEVQLMDWGLAKDAGRDAGLSGDDSSPADTPPFEVGETHPGTVLGTPGYMAPEQARGEIADARSDAFALGGILACILTGQPPFVAKTAADTVRRAAAADLFEVFARLKGCGADLELIVIARRCLAADPARRYPDGQAVAEAVTAYRAGVAERALQAQAASLKAEKLAEAEVEATKIDRRARKEADRKYNWAYWLLVPLLMGAAKFVSSVAKDVNLNKPTHYQSGNNLQFHAPSSKNLTEKTSIDWEADKVVPSADEFLRAMPPESEFGRNAGKVAAAHNRAQGAQAHLDGVAGDAVVYYHRAVRADPTNPEGYCGLADSLLATKQPALAVGYARRAVELAPGAASVRRLGLILVSAGERPEGEAILREAIAENPKDVDARLTLAAALAGDENWAEAVELALAAFRENSTEASKPDRESRYQLAVWAARAASASEQGYASQSAARYRVVTFRALMGELAALIKTRGGQLANARMTATLARWEAELAFEPYRSADGRASLPKSEQGSWERLWDEVVRLKPASAPTTTKPSTPATK